MTSATISRTPTRAPAARPVVDVLVERLALRLLAWSDARADRAPQTAALVARAAADAHAAHDREARSERVWSSLPYGK